MNYLQKVAPYFKKGKNIENTKMGKKELDRDNQAANLHRQPKM